ncbi:MAG: hypothetical protein OI74_04575 [Gammaproteobacteria bacterium (ex Lamellibrachia satsuma)]|nr:MAG: hypothetical protein HPY30_04630 [Gammaproteobacteria bacterium (ex Lamellibrachia satsuma)]RRS34684.1 MAG: hypothetical protein OI74_04575 [Gammaproteobacteria bacterium (ex Lamellibrachia satsuma)]RRS35279.1 MAG: hypothetical protein NV67_10995 [Gammaproteobacteria bacterium (ex Lamellibrachia satsuma)]
MKSHKYQWLRLNPSMISLLGMVLLLLLNGIAGAQSFAELQFDIIGVQLTVDPPALTVPKDIPTIVNTELSLPPGAGPEAQAALDRLRSETRVQAQLRGPSLPAIDIEVRPGDPFPIPPFALPGDYFLDQIRLVKDGETLLDGEPGLVPIKVISEILVTSVTSRALTLDEIREKGIVIDENNFDIREFQLALNVDGNTFKIRLPVALPTRELLAFQQTTPELIGLLSRVNAELNERQVVELPDDFDRPGLNFSIAAIPFMEAGADDGGPRPFGAPPITGLVVIPGNIAFLNQFFSVMVTVANVAPDGSLLSVRDLTAEITLPSGEDLVSGTFEQPGDDPLRLARIEGIGVQPVIDVMLPGPDGALGTADDVGVIPPQDQGAGEFLVEGLREGFHTVDIALSGILEGLPSGPVEIQGAAIGAVLVRDPTFDITLAHPRTIRSGEPYNLFATITNTSTTAANLVTVNLDERGVSGAVLDPNTEPTIVIDTLLPGDSFTQKFTLIAQKTGQVTAASFNSEPGVTGRFQITTGVGERGIPLSPNAIVLPDTTRFLPDGLVSAVLRVLGQAYSIANAPSGALPADVAFVRRQTVIDRGRELGEAGQRVAFGEPLADVLQDLLLDWLGDRALDNGFDQLLRQSNAGAALAAEFGAQFAPGVTASSLLDFLDAFARQTVTRDGHLAAVAGLGIGPAPVELRILDGAGNAAGPGPGPDGTGQTLPYAEVVPIITNGGRADLALVSRLDALEYIVEVTGTGSGQFDLGVSVPTGVGEVTLLSYSGVGIGPGGTARITIRLGQANSFDLVVDSNGDGVTDATLPAANVLITEASPQVLTVRQLESYNLGHPGNIFDPATYGLLVGVLFDKPVTEATATETANYAIESNSALGAVLQPSGRLAYLYLERPIGTLIDRGITISAIADERGNLLAADTRTIETVLADGAHVFGQLRTAAGEPVPDALFDLTVVISPFFTFDVSRIHTDSEGNFDFDFVRRIGRYFKLKAQHPETLDFTSLTAKVRAPGEEMLLFPTFRGKGSVRGQVTDAAGLPVAGAPVLLASPQMPRSGLGANTDALGEYIIPDVPVGTYSVRSFDGEGAFGLASGVVESAGEEAVTDIQLILQTSELGNLTGRVFLADGSTPGEGFSVYVGSYDRITNTVSAVDQAESDEAGSFDFGNLVPGKYDVVALDPTGAQLGVAGDVQVVAGITSSAVVVLEENGAVEGVVYNALGVPVEGALVAGGISLGVTDANGFFRIEGVPPGKRTIEAGNPLTKRRGSQSVTVLSNQTVNIAITLEARATIQGTVRDASGNPVPRATVRIVRSGGFEFVFANNAGQFRLPDRPLGGYLLQAPGPGQQGLIEFMKKRGIPACSAFTAIPPDPPADLNCQAQAPNFSDDNAALAAYQNALETAFNVSETLLSGPPEADLSQGFGWTKVDLFQNSTTVFADIDYLPLGSVSGVTLAGNGLPAAASTRISALGVAENGAAQFKEHGRMDTDLDTGEFAYGGIALFDLDTFQNTGIRSGTFQLEAASTLEPGRPTFAGELNVNTPNWDNIVLQFPLLAETSGTLSGTVFLPDGVTPAPANVDVTIDYGDGITVRTDPDGRFVSSFPIPKSVYTLTALDPISGLTGQARAVVLAGENTDIEIRLLGLGDARVIVKRPDGSLVPDVNVSLNGSGYPGDELDGVTNAAGEVQFFNVTEGKFGVMAEEQGTGLKGRASGDILRDSEVNLVLTLQGAGTITGTYLAADGVTPVANANVTLNARGVLAYANTDADGRFLIDAVPVGPFTVEASDPLTGRLGRASGELFVQGDLVDISIIQFGRGSVEGFVTQADGVTPVAGARVSLTGSGVTAVRLQSTTRVDGSFHFDGVTVGSFFLSATDVSTGFSGDAGGTIDFEGDLDVQNIILEGFGAVQVQVLGTDGNPVDNVEVTLNGTGGSRTAVVDTNGEFTFDFLKLGNYNLQAHSLANEHNGGAGETSIGQVGETAAVTLTLRGIGEVTVVVVDANAVLEPSARVNLIASARLPGEAGRLPFGGAFTAFTDASGQVSFPGVPVGEFFVSAESGPVSGVSTGVIEIPDQSVPITVELGDTGSVRGRMLLPDGFTAAASTYVTLHFQPQSSLQSGVLQITTDLTGEFEFLGIPLGPVTLDAFEPESAGVRQAAGTLTVADPDLDFADLTLDNSAPRVLTVTPQEGESGVAVDASVEILFSEPMQEGSLGSVRLMDGGTQVTGTITLFDGDTRAVFTPTDPLESDRTYSLTVDGAPAGPRDLVGLQLLDPYISIFRTADIIPPTVSSISPQTGETGVIPQEVVRLTFSESIQASIDLSLLDDGGQPVAGQVAMTLGDSVAIFTPDDFLQPNGTYTVVADNVWDLAGNALENLPFSAQFSTVDTLAPVLNFLALQGTPTLIEGTSVSVMPDVTGTDLARMEYVIDGQAPAVVDAAPFLVDVALPVGVPRVEITATAVDDSGNRSVPALLDIDVLPNQPPSVVLTSLTCGNSVGAGETCSFQATASDDLEVGPVSFSAIGVLNDSQTAAPSPGLTQFTTDFDITVPANAPSGQTLTVQAVATDSLAQISPSARLILPVEDRVAPQVAIDSPVNHAQVVPGASVNVQVSASDDLAVTTLALNCTPALAECTARTLSPPQSVATEVFTLNIPGAFEAPGTIQIAANATDAAGNSTVSPVRILQIADTLPPAVDSLATISGANRVLQGQAVTVRATASDNVDVAGLEFRATGDGLDLGPSLVPASPAGAGVTVDFSFTVPAAAANDSTIQVVGVAIDGVGNRSGDSTLTLDVGDVEPPVASILAPQPGTTVDTGATLTLTVQAEDDVGVQEVRYVSSGVRSDLSGSEELANPATPVEVSFNIPIPAATQPGDLSLSVTAIDAAGNTSVVQTVTMTVADAIAPIVTIGSPTAGSDHDPGIPLAVTIDASDNAGITEISLSASGSATVSETRVIVPVGVDVSEVFNINIATPPPAGGSVTLNATARDLGGNLANATPVSVNILDVVGPEVIEVTPADGASEVDLAATVVVRFSEAIDPASVTAASLTLVNGGMEPVDFTFSADNTLVTLVPSDGVLEPAADYMLTVDTAVTDSAGNTLTASFTSGFSTASPDMTPPEVAAISPLDGATGVSIASLVRVTFSEPIAPASLNGSTFQVSAGGNPLAGTLELQGGDTQASFLPNMPLPLDTLVVTSLTDGITDLAGNPLAGTLNFSFTTGAFSIAFPAEGETVPELTEIDLDARASAGLGVASVLFTVNGVELAPVAGPPFVAAFTTPAAADVPVLNIIASARNSSGVEIAQDAVTVNVGVGLRVTPQLLGVPLGGSADLNLSISTTLGEDLTIDLIAVDPGVAEVPSTPVILTAGSPAIDVPVNGLAEGSTSVLVNSILGTEAVVISVSTPLSGQELRPLAPAVGTMVQSPPYLGRVILPANSQRTLVLTVLGSPATADTSLIVSSNNSAVADILGSPMVPQNEVTVVLTIDTGAEGTAELILRAGEEVRVLTVTVGLPLSGTEPPLVAAPVGVVIPEAPSVGQVMLPAGDARAITLLLLDTPAAADMNVTVTSDNPAVADVAGPVVIPSGGQSAVLSLVTGVEGTAVLTLTADGLVRELTVFVGLPSVETAPPTVARPVGIRLLSLPSVGQVKLSVADQALATVRLLDQPAVSEVTVTFASGDFNVADVLESQISIPIGEVSAAFTLISGITGETTIRLDFGDESRELEVQVGDFTTGELPPTVAPSVGVEVQ